jgi:serine/threonine protein kinase
MKTTETTFIADVFIRQGAMTPERAVSDRANSDRAVSDRAVSDRTEQQDQSQQQRAQQLSLERTRPPAEIRGYDFQQFLGSGAYGEVWVATDRNTGRKVAVKFYTHRGGLDWQLLSREVEKLVLLSADRYIVQVLDVGWDATPPYYVMEFIENGSLDEYLKEHGPLPASEAVEMFRGVATGLMHAHNKGVLHCDVKPANVLLDQDHKPRLADFGQSRLSNEQTPALGTMFYMAPEQADMKAQPDARWDVYALGALLYLMLTGELPFRDELSVSQINMASGLEDRLATYRSAIRNAPAPAEHRRLRGIDRALVEIIDRCLAINPNDRFPNVQALLDALDDRERARARRPLLVIGILGPALLLAVMGIFGWRGYSRAMWDTDQAVMKKAHDSNHFAAQFVSSSVSSELDRYYKAVELVAQNETFVELFSKATAHEELAPMLAQLRDLDVRDVEKAPPDRRDRLRQLLQVRDDFESHPARQALQDYVSGLFKDPRKPMAASWFASDSNGTHVASAFTSDPPVSPIGRNFARRTYFNGLPQEQPEGWHPGPDEHIQDTHLSAVFRSDATNTWKVAIATPIVRGGKFLGVVALTVEMGGFLREFKNDEQRYAVLVDGRDGPSRGVILQHPLFEEVLKESSTLPDEFSKVRVRLNGAGATDVEYVAQYHDPLGDHALGGKYKAPWIMAKAPVKLRRGPPDANGEPTLKPTGWVVLVQENYKTTTAPVHNLGRRLMREGITAMAMVAVTVAALWFLVVRWMGEPTAADPRRASLNSEATPRSGKTTVPARG